MDETIVSWAGPLQRARNALDRASEWLERKDVSKGMDDLAECQRQINLAVAFIGGEEARQARKRG
jgi:hypothetical protein